jgi:hypothetical protein
LFVRFCFRRRRGGCVAGAGAGAEGLRRERRLGRVQQVGYPAVAAGVSVYDALELA